MPEYRIYELGDNGEPFGLPSVGNWKDDDEAKANAKILFDRRAIEIWCGERKVATIKREAPVR